MEGNREKSDIMVEFELSVKTRRVSSLFLDIRAFHTIFAEFSPHCDRQTIRWSPLGMQIEAIDGVLVTAVHGDPCARILKCLITTL